MVNQRVALQGGRFSAGKTLWMAYPFPVIQGGKLSG
jgi:hypothetical protein